MEPILCCSCGEGIVDLVDRQMRGWCEDCVLNILENQRARYSESYDTGDDGEDFIQQYNTMIDELRNRS